MLPFISPLIENSLAAILYTKNLVENSVRERININGIHFDYTVTMGEYFVKELNQQAANAANSCKEKASEGTV